MNENYNKHTTGSDLKLETLDKEMQDIILAHNYSTDNYPKIKEDKICGCFYCLNIFNPLEIIDWTLEPNGEHTALCPYCDIDSVIGDSSWYPVTEEFLKKMQKYWFNI